MRPIVEYPPGHLLPDAIERLEQAGYIVIASMTATRITVHETAQIPHPSTWRFMNGDKADE